MTHGMSDPLTATTARAEHAEAALKLARDEVRRLRKERDGWKTIAEVFKRKNQWMSSILMGAFTEYANKIEDWDEENTKTA